MSTTTYLYFSGKPITSPRPRATRQGHIYMPKKYMNEKSRLINEVAVQIKQQNHVILDEKCSIEIDFYFPAIKSMKNEIPVYKGTKPDIDNLIKTVLDVLTDAAFWTDDNIVVSITARKWYSINTVGQTLIKIDTFGGDNE